MGLLPDAQSRPQATDAVGCGRLRAALAEAHRRYLRAINQRQDWWGYLWQGRFASFPMGDPHLWACARYVKLNPGRAAD